MGCCPPLRGTVRDLRLTAGLRKCTTRRRTTKGWKALWRRRCWSCCSRRACTATRRRVSSPRSSCRSSCSRSSARSSSSRMRQTVAPLQLGLRDLSLDCSGCMLVCISAARPARELISSTQEHSHRRPFNRPRANLSCIPDTLLAPTKPYECALGAASAPGRGALPLDSRRGE